MKPRFSRRMINLVVVCLLFAVMFFAWQKTAKLQTQGDTKKQENENVDVTIHAKERGNPHINFKDGREIASVPNGQSNPSSQPKVLASADFDSDGIADLITADVSGNLKFHKGIEEVRKGDEEPFALSDKTFVLNISPDFLFAGDFNADGRQDVLATAKGTNFLVLLRGDGQGNFSEPTAVAVDGQITAIEAGEIGRKDGQTDLAVAIINKKGAFLLVFEHPESAFKHDPEVFKLTAPATDLAIGNLDEDFYADVAVASGNDLTIIYGRGQAYPWDLAPRLGIKRPAAFVATRKIPFKISAMTIGRFGEKRGETLALLGMDGNLYRLEPNRSEKPSNNKVSKEMLLSAKQNLFLPTDADVENLATLVAPPINTEVAATQGLIFDKNELAGGSLAEFLQKKQEEAAKSFKQTDKAKLEKILAENLPKKAEYKEKAKAAYLRSIAGKPSTLASWSIETLTTNSQFASAAASSAPDKMMRVNVSDSNLDDILVLAPNGNQIQLVSRLSEEKSNGQIVVTSLETESSPTAVLAMRLNLDALSDLIVLRQGASVPSVVMSAPANVFTVTSIDETGDCQGANLCSLRNAINLSNSSPGMDTIIFNLGSGVNTIALASQLPVITDAVSLQGSSDENGNKLVEISGVNVPAPADGLKIRASNSFIYNLAVNQFPSIGSSNSKIGGNGITIETALGSPRNGNNFVVKNYLGIDPTGSFAKGNSAAGLNIFDSDDNYVGGAGTERNVMSGNDGAGLAVTDGNNNFIVSSIIGLNALGTGKVGNGFGVFLTGANNSLGNDFAGDGNTISGNGKPANFPGQCAGYGIIIPELINLDTGELLTLNNNVKGNRLGTDPSGTIGLGNCYAAIITLPLAQTVIGSNTENGRNVVSDNGYNAIYCVDSSFHISLTPDEGGFCAIAGNNIGTDITGSVAIPNNQRNNPGGAQFSSSNVNVFNGLTLSNIGAPGGTSPGVACTGFCNLISGNTGDFAVSALAATGFGVVGVFSNFVGTNRNGTQAIPNGNGGVLVSSLYGETYVGLGVPDEPFGNLISGNYGSNVFGGDFYFHDFLSARYVEGNLIGTDATGTFALRPPPIEYGRNGGIEFSAFYPSTYGSQVFIGAANAEARNVISGNTDNGINLINPNNLLAVKVANNLIGLNRSLQPLGNGASGIKASGDKIRIGGSDQEANQIAYNGTTGQTSAGVTILSSTLTPTGTTVTVRNNSIHDNVGLGIDLSAENYFGTADGVTANDCRDEDTGANGLQNFPLLDAPTFNVDGTVTITGALLSFPREQYSIDFYSNSAPDPTNNGEGEFYIGSIAVESDGSGAALINFTSARGVSAAYSISATATDRFGNTSEFSCNAGATCAGNFAATNNMKPEDYERLAGTCSPVEAIIVNIESNEDDAQTSLNQNVCDVNTDMDGNQCSLRAAIQVAEHHEGFDRIVFAILGEGVHIINAPDGFPVITQPVFIDGASQTGYNGSPLIEISARQDDQDNFLLQSALSVTLKGLSFSRIRIENGGGHRIESCYIGVKADGVTPLKFPQYLGVIIYNSNNNTIGGDDGKGNVISGFNNTLQNQTQSNCGITFQKSDRDMTGNKIIGNKIGTNSAGTAPVPNVVGINYQGSVFDKNLDVDIERNIISGNTYDGINFETIADAVNINILNNLIGTNADETSAIPNGKGIIIISHHERSLINISDNDIAGNISFGIFVLANKTVINGNHIGITRTGSILSNEYGIYLENASGVQIGTGGANVIAGNLRAGIVLAPSPQFEFEVVNDAKIENNYVGVFPDTNARVGNGVEGEIVLSGKVNRTLIKNNTISGRGGDGINVSGLVTKTTISENKVSGSTSGISLREGSTQTKILDNIIGRTDDSPNTNLIGVRVFKSSDNLISQNTLSGNAYANILLGNLDYNELPSGNPAQPSFVEPISPNNSNTLTANNEITLNQIENSDIGIAITEGARRNFIGKSGDSSASANIISGNSGGAGYGIFLGTTRADANESSLPFGNEILNNQIRDDNKVGLVIQQAQANFIGSDGGIESPNYFLANREDGIKIVGALTKDNQIFYNRVGVLESELDNAGYGNGGDGIVIAGAGENLINYNIIGNNRGSGITLLGLSLQPGSDYSVIVAGNHIGVLGNTKIGNTNAGIRLDEVQNALIGRNLDPQNIIAGNGGDGVLIEGGDSRQNFVSNSIIGTNETGANDLGNGGSGIYVIGGGNNTIGGVQSVGNVVAGNQGNGILMQDSTQNKIYGNKIGIFNANGANVKLGNNANGVEIMDTEKTSLGDEVLNGYRNLIGGNVNSGIIVKGESSQFNQIRGNFIGTDSSNANLGNQLHGVLVTEGGNHTNIGGTGFESGNKIAFNGGDGVRIDPTALCCNLIDPNAIFGNTGLGIDIGTSGRTPNDANDADSGANNLQNYPEIVSKQIVSGELVIGFKIDSSPSNSNYGANGLYVEFFKADNSGEGERFLGFTYYTVADHDGSFAGTKTVNLGDITTLGITSADMITATATDADNNTSEFFPPFGPSAANVTISGQVKTKNGIGIPKAKITLVNAAGESRTVLTSSFGRYSFNNVSVGETYVISVQHKWYQFTQSSQVINPEEDLDVIDFIALE